VYDRISYEVKQRAGDRGITAENMEKSQHTDFNKDTIMKALVWPVAVRAGHSERMKKHVLTPLR